MIVMLVNWVNTHASIFDFFQFCNQRVAYLRSVIWKVKLVSTADNRKLVFARIRGEDAVNLTQPPRIAFVVARTLEVYGNALRRCGWCFSIIKWHVV